MKIYTIFMNSEISKINASHTLKLHLSQKPDLTRLHKHVSLWTLCIYYTLENEKKNITKVRILRSQQILFWK